MSLRWWSLSAGRVHRIGPRHGPAAPSTARRSSRRGKGLTAGRCGFHQPPGEPRVKLAHQTYLILVSRRSPQR